MLIYPKSIKINVYVEDSFWVHYFWSSNVPIKMLQNISIIYNLFSHQITWQSPDHLSKLSKNNPQCEIKTNHIIVELRQKAYIHGGCKARATTCVYVVFCIQYVVEVFMKYLESRVVRTYNFTIFPIHFSWRLLKRHRSFYILM